jgi:hypothetical protein
MPHVQVEPVHRQDAGAVSLAQAVGLYDVASYHNDIITITPRPS